jgi:transcriptional regulator with XRE-family HTH domain
MRYSAQIRAARALLGWSQDRLARRAEIGLATLRRIEQVDGMVKGNFSTILKIQKALEQAGIHFTEDDGREIGVSLKMRSSMADLGENGDGPGVRVRKRPKEKSRK